MWKIRLVSLIAWRKLYRWRVQNYDSLKRSRSRLNAYRALASPAYMALSSPDPIMSTFELRQEMKKLAQVEKEFKVRLRLHRHPVLTAIFQIQLVSHLAQWVSLFSQSYRVFTGQACQKVPKLFIPFLFDIYAHPFTFTATPRGFEAKCPSGRPANGLRQRLKGRLLYTRRW